MNNLSSWFLSRSDAGPLFEVLLARSYHRIVRHGDVVVDGGACGGLHTLPLARLVGEQGKVWAYEPTPESFQNLKKWIDYANLSDIAVLRQAALNSESTELKFYTSDKHSALNSLVRPPQDGFNEISVKAVTLDDELSGVENVSFVKLDLEGGEYSAFKGGRELLKRCRPTVVFENTLGQIAKNIGYTKWDFLKIFSDANMHLCDILGREVTEDTWEDSGYAWYFVATPRKEDAATFLREAKSLMDEVMRDDRAFKDYGSVMQVVQNYGIFPK